MNTEEIDHALHSLIVAREKDRYVEGHVAEMRKLGRYHNELVYETLGAIVSSYAKWDGIGIMIVAAEALEDANFHAESAAVREMMEKYLK